LNDILSTAKKMMSSPLTMASWGDGMFTSFELSHSAQQGRDTNQIALIAVIHVPSYESVSRKFHSK
jgi:processing peptidase subunit alpha